MKSSNLNSQSAGDRPTTGVLLELIRPVASLAPLPKPLTRFIGRDRELESLTLLLRSGVERLITLTGPGGVGKTRMAIEAAASVAPDFHQALHFIGLAAVTKPDQVVPAIALALGLRDENESSGASVRSYVSDRRVLLVLDNLEQVAEAGVEIGQLVVACRRLVVLATSREVLRIRGERAVAVAPLDLPVETETGEPTASAVQFFVDRVRAVRPDFELNPGVTREIGEICRRLDGLPLAIELAAARCNILSPGDLLRRMERLLPVLSSGPRDLPARQRTMRDTIAWSYDLLSDGEKSLLQMLGVFAGGFTLEAAESIWEDVTDPQTTNGASALDLLASLVQKSLVRFDAGRSRHELFELLREYAVERLTASGSSAAIQRAHADFYLRFVEQHEIRMFVPVAESTMQVLEVEHANLLVAARWLADVADDKGFVRLVSLIGWSWWLRGAVLEGEPLLQLALARCDETDHLYRAKIATVIGFVRFVQRKHDDAERYLIVALADARESGETLVMLHALIGLGVVCNDRADYDRAVAWLDEALTLAETLPDPRTRAIASGHAHADLGVAMHGKGRLDTARELHERALRLQRDADYTFGVLHDVIDLGDVTRDCGDAVASLRYYREGLRLAWQLDQMRAVAIALLGIANLLAGLGDSERAARLFAAAHRTRAMFGFTDRTPFDQAVDDRTHAALLAALGTDGLSAAYTRSQEETLERAVAEALVETESEVEWPIAESTLSPRELEVLRFMVAGYADRQIAEVLFIGIRTVESHVARICTKLGVRGRTAAVVSAIREGLVLQPGSGDVPIASS